MKIYGLSGKSGTGKSYNAAQLCSTYNIEAIIDDGLFIYHQEVAAGISAKKEETRLKAVRRAIFSDDDHAQDVMDALRRVQPESLLVIGTSEEMVLKICGRLQLPAPERIIHIEEITTEAQRKIAKKQREEAGIHVIPVPTMQVKNQFSGYFIDAKKGFRREGERSRETDWIETIVRPTYSYLGEFNISAKVINDIVYYIAADIPGIAQIIFVSSKNIDEGMYIRVIVQFRFGAKVKTSAWLLQQRVHDDVEAMTAFNILGIEVEGRGFADPSI